MLKKESENGKPVWPTLQALIGNQINVKTNWTQHEIIHQQNQYLETMVSFIVTENLQSFNNNPDIRDKNFKQLTAYVSKRLVEQS